MKEALLITLFLINGEPSIQDGYHPMAIDTTENCLKSREFLNEYLSSIDGLQFLAWCLPTDMSDAALQYAIETMGVELKNKYDKGI